jgi:S1-C subfamily serine protease
MVWLRLVVLGVAAYVLFPLRPSLPTHPTLKQPSPIAVDRIAPEACPPYVLSQLEDGSVIDAIVNESLQVQIVLPCGAGEEAGLTGGDRLLAFNGQKILNLADLQRLTKAKPQTVELTIVRELASPVEHHTLRLKPRHTNR